MYEHTCKGALTLIAFLLLLLPLAAAVGDVGAGHHRRGCGALGRSTTSLTRTIVFEAFAACSIAVGWQPRRWTTQMRVPLPLAPAAASSSRLGTTRDASRGGWEHRPRSTYNYSLLYYYKTPSNLHKCRFQHHTASDTQCTVPRSARVTRRR